MNLADALDTYIPTPERVVDGAFLMPVEDVFSISGRGTVVTGRRARHRQGRRGNRNRRYQADGEDDLHGRGNVPQAARPGPAGDNVGILLRGTKREDAGAARFWPSRVRSRRTRTSRLKCTC
ncbi:hypothetical protein P5X00_13740 [Paraburkholderia sp. A2RO-4L]|uniref:hypothetical protein n=1 Tax=Paraburkholderia sp. A2RO-4L TaxID=3028374 RepID=UPI003DA7B52C